MLNYNIVIKNTKELNTTEFNSIIKLKQQYWPYEYDSQTAWFKKNIVDEDMHVLIYDAKRLIAYCNCIFVNIYISMVDGVVCVRLVLVTCVWAVHIAIVVLAQC